MKPSASEFTTIVPALPGFFVVSLYALPGSEPDKFPGLWELNDDEEDPKYRRSRVPIIAWQVSVNEKDGDYAYVHATPITVDNRSHTGFDECAILCPDGTVHDEGGPFIFLDEDDWVRSNWALEVAAAVEFETTGTRPRRPWLAPKLPRGTVPVTRAEAQAAWWKIVSKRSWDFRKERNGDVFHVLREPSVAGVDAERIEFRIAHWIDAGAMRWLTIRAAGEFDVWIERRE